MGLKTVKDALCCFYIRGFPRTLRQHFAAMCNLLGVTMKDRLTIIVREDIEKFHGSKDKNNDLS